ncbi:GNAT family N-acetyltransferase [Beijerinckia sp. L45]|uniref:GNAT family N-acetyltransferase n=1 Tax=Beijerinckia sp. L45 TaxID=1641855 RepID=UPI00131B12C2|nr:GNAT family N-acetyltransferase [Beijerinckia sp. L45]
MAPAPEQRIIDEERSSRDSSGPDGAGAQHYCAPQVAIHVERVTARAMLGFQPAWSDLLTRALEPNVFLDPAFALPLLQHVRFETRPDFLLVWEDDGPTSFGRLVGLLPIHLPQSGWRLARGFHHQQVTLGTPLLDSLRGAEALEAMLSWIADNHRSPALVLSEVPVDGPFCGLLRAQSASLGRAIAMLDGRERAILMHAEPNLSLTVDPSVVVAIQSAKRRKELRRQRRRLGESGRLTYHSARTPTEIRRAAERFMALEAGGWKGRRGSALLADPTLATFTRTMTRLMGYEARCRIDSLEVDGVPVAMGILVMAGTRAHFWKTTYNERFASLSPGVQFALDLTQVQGKESGFSLTDSCAVPDHPMIDRIWPDRMAVADLLIELRPTKSAGVTDKTSRSFSRAVQAETIRRRLRALAKRALKAAVQWRRRWH